MRLALIPLDSRPPNTRFPERLARIAGVSLVQPPHEMLGSLHRGTDGIKLAQWLRNTALDDAGQPGCSAVVISWDALIHGGLIQSRQWDGTHELEPVANVLRGVDWRRVAGYAFITVPRLGISVLDSGSWARHELVREYFIEWGRGHDDAQAKEHAGQIAAKLGEQTVAALWAWRRRNLELVRDALTLSRELGLRRVHVAIEDNAPYGPHLDEVAALCQVFTRADASTNDTEYTFFDGADEAGCLLLARAITDARGIDTLPVQLTVHPTAPGADQYTGLYESHPLGDGLTLLADMLGLEYRYDEQEYHWLVAHGVQPQPDVFAQQPAAVFDNPYLLPRQLHGTGKLFVSDLCACNGANPRLAGHLAEQRTVRLQGLVGFNTNFNTLAVSAAWLRLAHDGDPGASRRFLLERLADDVAYQSIARPQVLEYLLSQGLDPLDFSTANQWQVAECQHIVDRCWRDWCEGDGAAVLSMTGTSRDQAATVEFSFPWSRAFEVLASASG